MRRAPNGFLFVNGTPTDCVHLAVTGLLDELPDMVISGINLGANMGDDTIYSGTVAAATEGFLLGIPSIADLAGVEGGAAFRDRRATIAVRLVERHARMPRGRVAAQRQRARTSPRSDCTGIAVTRLGRRHKAEDVIRTQNPRGETVYWVGAAGAAADAGEGTDFHAVGIGHVSVTPLQIDLTNRELSCDGRRGAGSAHERAHRYQTGIGDDVGAHPRADDRTPARAGHRRRGRARLR